MKMMVVREARNAFEGINIALFAAEMGISISDATAVQNYINRHDVPDDSIVIMEETIIDGVKMGAGNVRL